MIINGRCEEGCELGDKQSIMNWDYVQGLFLILLAIECSTEPDNEISIKNNQFRKDILRIFLQINIKLLLNLIPLIIYIYIYIYICEMIIW